MMKLMMKNYCWPGVMKDVRKYIDECNLCQRMKNKIEVPVGKLMANKILKKIQIYLMVDFIIKLLLVVEKNIILVVCNRLSKIAYFIAIIKGIPVEGLAKMLKDNMQKLYRLLESIINDREPQFVVDLTKELNKILQIEIKLLMAFHTQIDGQME